MVQFDVWHSIKIKAVRTAVMFVLGAGTFVHEVLVEQAERPTIIGAALALMGLPFFLAKDESEGKS